MNDIPFVDLGANLEELSPEVFDVVRRVISAGRYVLGPEVAAFEREFARFCGVDLKTIHHWAARAKLRYHRTDGGHLRGHSQVRRQA